MKVNSILKFLKVLPFSLNIDLLEDVYWNAGQKLVHTIRDIRDEILTDVRKNKVIVAEFGRLTG